MQIYKYLVEALVGDVNLRTKCYVFDLKKNIFKTGWIRTSPKTKHSLRGGEQPRSEQV